MQGQIIKILSNLYFVDNGLKVYACHSRGKFRKDKITPVVGDFVKFDEKQNYILEILPRKNSLIRPFVANIDQAMIITSVKLPDFSTNLLDKLLLVMEINNIEPIICITKYDLLDDNEKVAIDSILKYYKEIGYLVYKNDDITEIQKLFKDKTTVFTGQTGAGKSTLLNRLDNTLNLKTGEVSIALGRGKHTTRHVELIKLFDGKVLDTPGFSSINISDYSNKQIRDAFIEFRKYPCLYKDCSHLNEGECNIKKEVELGNILPSRYENYKKFILEKGEVK